MKFTKLLKKVVAIVILLGVTAAFFGVPHCEWFCRIEPAPSWGFVGVLVLTLLWGRFFCEVMCPLGIIQTIVNKIFHPKTQVRRVCSRLPETNAQRVVRYLVLIAWVALVALGVGSAWCITPYAIYGKAFSGVIGGALLVFVLLTAAIGQGRFWCNWICPLGTIFNLLSKFAWRKQKIVKCCANCRKCFAAQAPSAKADNEPTLTRREAVKGVALLAAVEAAEKTTDGGFAAISLHTTPERAHSVWPPGARSRSHFTRTCVGCDLCVARCPGKCLTPSLSLKTFGQVEMDFAKGHCILGCTTCSAVCPSSALEKLSEELKLNTHVGRAVWHQERCLRADGTPCRACIRKCPVKAIHEDEKGVLSIDETVCLGCGACEHVCAARPKPAMVVEGYDEQRMVRPIGEEDLVAEMIQLVNEGNSVVLAKEGVITGRETGSGIKPVLDLYEQNALKDAIVVDKIIGRAAASICVAGGAKKVVGLVMSEGAKAFLNAHGVPARGIKLVPMIVNRKGTGQCPMEERVKSLNSPEAMVKELKK